MLPSSAKGSVALALRSVDSTTIETTLSAEEGRDLFERESRRLLGIGGDEFLRRWSAGEYAEVPETPETRKVMRVAFLIPFVQQDS